MRGESDIKKQIICVSMVLIFLFSFFPCSVFGQRLKTVRIGFFQNDGYDKGIRSGYGYEMLQHMVGYTNWNCEYVGYDKSWNQMLAMLENGGIDVLTNAIQTDELKELFDFSQRPIGTSATILTVKAGNREYPIQDYERWNGIRVGMLDQSIQNQQLVSFAKEKGFTYRPVYFENLDEMLDALKKQESIDAVVSNNLRTIEGEWIYAELNVVPFYVGVKKGNAQLMDEIDHALERLYQDTPLLQAEVWDKYYAPINEDVIGYTVDEIDFIEKNKATTFKAIINSESKPFSSFNKGQPVGINSEIAKEIIRRSGLDVEIIECENKQEYDMLVNSGTIDICLDAQQNYSAAEDMGFRLTIPYLDETVSRLYRKGDRRKHKSVALLKTWNISSEYEKKLISEYADVVYYDTVDKVVEAISKGKQDEAFLYSCTCERAVQNDITNRLAAEKLYGVEANFCMAVSAKQDDRLFSIFNKAIVSISNSEISEIVHKHTSYEEAPFTIVGFAYDNPIFLLALVIIIFILIILALIVVFLTKKRRQQTALLMEEKRRNQLLIDALEAAEKGDAAKSQFLSRVSHEMRTPLNAIIGFITLAKANDGNQIDHYLHNSEIAAKQLLSVINDVLDMSSIESGKIEIANEAFDFKQVINAISNLYGAQCEQKGLIFETQLLAPIDERLVGDELRLKQVLLNLLGNAVKFTEKGSIYLKVRQLVPKGDKVFIRFEITDTGCGMSSEMQTRLFKPFEQESAITAQKFGGSGLGLSIVKNLISLMDGAICVQSQLGTGSTFVVDLPFTKSHDKTNAFLSPDFKQLRVLVADSEAVECNYISEVLNSFGIPNTCVERAEEVIPALERGVSSGENYNVCLLDWKIPFSHRAEVIQGIRQTFGKKIYIVVVSACQNDVENKRTKTLWIDMFVAKPLFQSTLYDLFTTIIGERLSTEKKAIPQAQNMLQSLAGMRVLLAEDNAMNCMVAVGLLKKFGIECDVAQDGKIALEKFIVSEPGHYDAILMDVQMPNMDGFQASSNIRESSHPDAKKINIIALTANALNEDIAKSFSNGMNDHVSKPIDPEELHCSLSRALD